MKKKLVVWWRDYLSLLSLNACIVAVTRFSHLPGNLIKNFRVFVRKANGIVMLSEEDLKNITEQGEKFLDKSFFMNYLKDIEDFKRRYNEAVADANSMDFKGLSNPELGNLLLKLAELEGEGIAYYWGSQYEPLVKTEQKLKNILRKKYEGRELEEVLATLVTPIELDNILKEELDWIELVLKNENFTKKLFYFHGKKYSWLFRNTFDIKVCFDFLKERFERYKKEHVSGLNEKARKIISQKKALALKQKNIIDEIGDHVSYLLAVFHKMSLSRMELKYTWAGFEFLLHDFLQEISGRTKVPLKDMILYLTTDEIVKLLNNELKIPEREIREREKFYLIGSEEGRWIFRYGAKELEKAQKEHPDVFEEKKITELKGTIANPGKARGMVVIVPIEDLESLQRIEKRFKKGNILITPMTQPNTVVLMEKAAAIVTDEGGLTSHAAIVSRELGIPCIVGTLHATEVFKDGDVVEVDAEKGVVRKLG
jgi:phosphohistidine swiveling domain-containing protein